MEISDLQRIQQSYSSGSQPAQPPAGEMGSRKGEPRYTSDAGESAERIESRIREKVIVDQFAPVDWIWETLAVLEAEGKLKLAPSAAPEPQESVKLPELKQPTGIERGMRTELCHYTDTSVRAFRDAALAEIEWLRRRQG